MTPEELLKAENAFIRLHNQGVSVEDIAERLGVEIKIVEEWSEKLKSAVQSRNNPANLDVTVQEINEKGEYTYHNSIQFAISDLEKLKFDLWRLSNPTIREGIAPEVKKMIADVAATASEYLPVVDDIFEDIKFTFLDNRVKVSYSYYLDDDNNARIDKAQEIIAFHNRYALSLDVITMRSTLIKEVSLDVFQRLGNILPYCLKQIKVQRYQDIKVVSLINLPVDTQWIFIAGENGYGKTSFLRTIALGLYGSEDDGRVLVESAECKVGIEFKNNNYNSINNLWTPDFQSLEHIACYGPSRLQIQAKMSQNAEAERSSTTYGLFNPDGILLNIESKLIEWHIENNVRFEQTKVVFQRIIPSLAEIIVRKNEQDDYEVLYVEQAEDEEQATFDPVSFDKLAAGFRSIIGLVGDLLIRFIRKQPEVAQLSELAGIVLIDELENHLHPKWQYRLPTLLSEVFPNIQFIAATHSVIPILGAPKNAVFLKLNRSKEQGITVERVDIDVANLLPNSILTSPIFDMDTIKPLANEDIRKLRTEDTFDEFVAHDEVDKQLRDLDNDPSQYPALLQE